MVVVAILNFVKSLLPALNRLGNLHPKQEEYQIVSAENISALGESANSELAVLFFDTIASNA